MNRSLLIGVAVLGLACSSSALAHIDVGIAVGIPGFAFGVPGAVVAPPAYYPPVEYAVPASPMVLVPAPLPAYMPHEGYRWRYRRYDRDHHDWREHSGWHDQEEHHGDEGD